MEREHEIIGALQTFTPQNQFRGANQVWDEMKKQRGHYCRVCRCVLPNEAFSGKGHRVHVCKECARLPKDGRDAIEHREEIFRYLRQSHISPKNVSRLKELTEGPNEEVAALASLVLEVASVRPHKKRRLKILAKERRDLLERLEETGLILAHHA